MSLHRHKNAPGGVGFPRVSGDEPEWFALVPGFNAFSPRERG